MRIRWIVATLALCWSPQASIATPAATPGQPATLQLGKLAQAKALYQKGSTAYRLARFARALSLFEKALGLASRPSLLFNIAQCHRQLGHVQKALFSYRLYISESERLHPRKPIPFFDEVRKRITELEAQKASPATQPATNPALVSSKPPHEPAKDLQQATLRAKKKRWYQSWWFWTAVAGVAAAAATVTAVAISASNTDNIPVGTLGKVQLDSRAGSLVRF
jgi:tetratricopeptide (TPR) repeat protein